MTVALYDIASCLCPLLAYVPGELWLRNLTKRAQRISYLYLEALSQRAACSQACANC